MTSARHIKVPGKGTNTPNPLTKYSLLGSATELAKFAVEQAPLLDLLCLTGDATAWYAKWNTGKTMFCLHLIEEAIRLKRIDARNVIYVNADDNSSGLVEKARLFDDLGVHMLAPGHMGFQIETLTARMEEMVGSDSARGVFIIVDTLKKFVDVMDKRATRVFTSLVRRFVMSGGTFLALAHTTKRNGPDGRPVPEGTADVLNDFDCGYLLETVGEDKETGERIVQFTCVKNRGRAARKAYYVYDPDPDLSYVDRLCSIRKIDSEQYVERVTLSSEESDIIETIELCITHGTVTKMAISKTAAKALKIGGETVRKVLESHTGEDPQVHRWNFDRREHGRMVYYLLRPRDDGK